jgi:flagella basal body P-ring formation protein FlgA
MVETFEAAVLTRPVAQNEILKRSDFATIRRPKTELASNPLTNPEEAAGLAARRALRPGQLIRLTDLMKPELVQKNESVTISYQVPGIVLTVRGQALEAGAQGDVINVLNVQSKKTVSAIVTGPGRVSVTAIMPRVATTLAPAAPFPLNDTPETAE